MPKITSDQYPESSLNHHEPIITWSIVKRHAALCKPGLGMLLLVLGLLGALSQLFSAAQFTLQLHMKLADFVGTPYKGAAQCSGHGIVIMNAKCLCDLGFSGSLCSKVVSHGLSRRDIYIDLTKPIANTVLIVTEHFGQINPSTDLAGESYFALAQILQLSNYTVSVLYIGIEESPMFWKASRDLLYPLGINYGENPVEERSYETYQYLIRSPVQYDIVQFEGASGAAFYTLQAQKQGLICSQTKYIVHLDRLPPGSMESIAKQDSNFLISDINTLKSDYIIQKSIELAKTSVLSSRILLQSLHTQSWALSAFNTHVINGIVTLSSSISSPPKKNINAREFVFVGPMTTLNGLKIFCEAVDNVAYELGRANIAVSFVGIPKSVDGVASREWIDIYAGNWEEYGLLWNIVQAESSSDILGYLSSEEGRIAVLPSLFEASSVLGQEILYNGLPFIASSQSAVKEMIVLEDRNQVLVDPTVDSLAKKLLSVIKHKGKIIISFSHKVSLVRPIASKPTNNKRWLDLYSKLSADNAPTCNKKYESTKDIPLVSVVLVHHNRGMFLKQAVESIEAQTYANIEVILIDDGSTDKESIKIMEDITWSWWETKGWKVIREKNNYLGAARNTGVKHAVGKYVVFMDDDDIAKPHQVETLVRVAINQDAEVVTSGHDVFTGIHKPFLARTQKRYLPIGPATQAGMLENIFGDSKMLVNRESFIAAGGFTEDFGVGFEDYEFLAKMALSNKKMEAISESLNWYRRHDEAMSYQTNLKANQQRMLRAYVQVNEDAPRAQRELLQNTQELFFNRHGARAFEFEQIPSNVTSSSVSYLAPTISTSMYSGTKTGTVTALPTNKVPPTTTTSSASIATATGMLCPLELQDCSGKCPGIDAGFGYNIDCRGKCVSSDQTKHYDQCGVCGGSGNTCKDCHGIVNGTAEPDLCGVCAGTGSTCHVYFANEPNVIPNNPGINFTIYGAGFVFDPKNKGNNNTRVFINGVEIPPAQLLFVEQQWIVVSLPEARTLLYEVDILKVQVTQPGQNFSMIDLYVYDSTSSEIQSISPSNIAINQTALISLSGSFLTLDSSVANLTCIFDDGSANGQISLAIMDRYGNMACFSQLFQSSMKVPFYVVYSTPRYPTPYYTRKQFLRPAYYLNEVAPVALYIYDSAPLVTQAYFSNSGSSIIINFNSDINIIDPVLRKRDFFSPLALANGVSCDGILKRGLSANYSCKLTQPKGNVLMIAFSYNSSALLPGEKITFIKDTIFQVDCLYCESLKKSFVVSAPAILTLPSVIVRGPAVIGPCADLSLDLASSTGQLGRSWKAASLTYTFRGGNGSLVALNSLIGSFQNGLLNGHTSFDIAKSALPLGSYTFTVGFQNFLGKFASGSLTVKKQALDVPYLVLSSEYGFENLRVETIQNLRARVISKCPASKNKSVTFSWSNDLGLIPAPSQRLSSVTFPKYTFSPLGFYSFNLSYAYAGEAAIITSYTLSFGSSSLSASAGVSKTVGDQNIIMIRPIIVDPSYALIDASRYKVQYFCTTVPMKGNCLSKGANIDFGSSALGRNLSSLLVSGTKYLIGVRVTNIITKESVFGTNALIDVVAGKVPIIDIHAVYLVPGHLQTLDFDTSVSAVSSALNISYSWTALSACALSSFSTVDLGSGVSATDLYSSRLKFVEGALSPATSFCFEVTATDIGTGYVGRSSIQASTLDVPNGGSCYTTGTAPVGWSVPLEIQCSGWTGDYLPLKYEFSLRPKNSSVDWTIISPMQGSSNFLIVLPPGDWEILTVVYDSTYSVNAATSIIVSIKNGPYASAGGYLDIINNDFVFTQDSQLALQAIGAAAGSLPANTTSATYLLSKVLDLIDSVRASDDWFIDQYESAPFIGSLLRALVGKVPKLSPMISARLFSLTSSIAQTLQQSYTSDCYTADVSTEFYNVVDALLTSLNSTNAPLSIVDAYYANTMASLRTCIYQRLSCNEAAYQFSGESISLSLGINAADNINNACNFDSTSLGNIAFNQVSGGQCIEYECRSNEPLSLLVPQSVLSGAKTYQAVAVGSSSLHFFDLNQSELNVRNGVISGYITDDWISSNWNISNFVNGIKGGGYRPVIARLLGDSSVTFTLDTKTVSLTNITGNKYYFASSAAGTFALLVENNSPADCNPLFKDCAGYCAGDIEYGHNLDCTGQCVSTLKQQTNDVCGVCSGNGKSCLDCNGSVHGKAEVDVCGVCGGTGSTCNYYVANEPNVLPNRAGVNFTIFGAGFSGNSTNALNNTIVAIDGVLVPSSRLTFVNHQWIVVTISMPFVFNGNVTTMNVSVKQAGLTYAPLPIYIYDPKISHVDGISPVSLRLNTSSLQILSGSFLAFASSVANTTCVFDDGSVNGLSSPAVLSNGQLKCVSPAFAKSESVGIHVLYSAPRYSTPYYSKNQLLRSDYYLNEAKPLSLHILDSAPAVLMAQFSDSGLSIQVKFSGDVYIIDSAAYQSSGNQTISPVDFSQNVYCSEVFGSNSGSLYTLESLCTITQPSNDAILLTFAYGSTSFAPGDSLVFQPNTVVKQSCQFCDTLTGSVSVAGPANLLTPTVVINGPSMIGLCADLTLDLSQVSGELGHPWKSIKFSFTTNASNTTALTNYIDSVNAAAMAGSTSIGFSKSILPTGTFSFSFTYTNFFGGSKSGSLTVLKQSREVPYVVVSSDNGFDNLRVNAIQTLRAHAILNCSVTASRNIVYSWSDKSGLISGPMSNLSTVNFAKYVLAPLTSYQITLSFWYQGEKAFGASTTFTIATGQNVITASAGVSQDVGVSNTIIVTPIILDDAYQSVDSTMYTASYQCSAKSKGQAANCISRATGKIIVFGKSASGINLSGQLQSDTQYLLRATFTNIITGATVSSSFALLNVVSGAIPMITINPSSLSIGYQETLELNTVTTSISGSVSYAWSLSSSCAYGNFEERELLESDVNTSLESRNLKVAANVLQSSLSYCFQVTATDSVTNLVGRSSVQVKVLSAPSGGICAAIGGNTGFEFLSSFTIQCSGWTADAMPLKYAFSAQPDVGSYKSTGWIALAPAQSSASFTTMLPAGNWIIQISVMDRTFSKNVGYSTVSFVISPLINKRSIASPFARTLDYLSSALVEYSHTQDVQEALTSLGVGLIALPMNVTGSDASFLQDAIISFAGQLISSGNWYLDQNIAASFLGSLTKTLVGDVFLLNQTKIDAISTLIETVVTGLYESDIASCFDGEVVDQFLYATDGLLTSLNASSSKSLVFTHNYNEILRTLENCRFSEITCGEDSSFTGSSLSLSFGRNNKDDISDICHFVMESFRTVKPDIQSDDCIHYICKSAEPITSFVSSDIIANSSGIYGIAVGSVDLKFKSAGKPIGISGVLDGGLDLSLSGANISGYITDQWLSKNWDIASFKAGSIGGYKPVVVYVNGEGSSLKLGATIPVTNIIGNNYFFDASSNGTFALLITDNFARPAEACPGFYDCAGYCPGQNDYQLSSTDCAGVCRLNTSPLFQILDKCNVCGGSNACIDCHGIVGGKNIIDVCGICSAPDVIPECFALVGTEPSIVPNVIDTIISLYGAGFSNQSIVFINGKELDRSSYACASLQIITVVLPFTFPMTANIGSADITVSNIDGQNITTAFSFYDDAKSILERIAPLKAYTGQPTLFTISGSNIPSVSTALCVFKEDSITTYSDFKIANSKIATCSSEFSESGDVTVNVLLSKPKYPTATYPDITVLDRPEYFVRQLNGVFDVQLKERAPLPVSSQFDSTGAAIYFDFSGPISILSNQSSYQSTGEIDILEVTSATTCSNAFMNSASTGSQLWRSESESDCILTQLSPTRLKLSFSGDFTLDPTSYPIIPGNNITIKPDSIVAFDAVYSDASSGYLSVQQPAVPSIAYVSVSAPSLIGSCANFVMDLSSSYGSAGRNWQQVTIKYTSSSNLTTAKSLQDARMINGNLTAQSQLFGSGKASTITIDRSIMEGAQYKFTVTLTNFLGGSGSQDVYLQKVTRDDIPYIILTSDNGMTGLDVSVVQILRATAVPIAGCGQPEKINFMWRYKSSTFGADQPVFSADAQDKSALVIEPFQLSPNSGYNLALFGQFNSSDIAYEFDISIATALDIISASAGPSRKVGSANVIIMTPTIIDSSYATFNSSVFDCSWNCFDTSTGSACINQITNTPLVLNSCLSNNITGLLGASSALGYKFTIIVTNRITGSTTIGVPAYLTVLDGIVPIFSIIPSDLTPGVFSQVFNIQAKVDTASVSSLTNLTYQWATPQTCFGNGYSTIKLIQDVTIQTNPTHPNLMFIAGTLTPSTSYCFELTVIDNADGAKGVASIIITTREAPFAGICQSSISSGVAFTDTFIFKCSGWVTDPLSYPLNYVFFIRQNGTSSWSTIGSQSSSSQFSTELAKGSYEVQAQVVDAAFSQNAKPIILAVNVLSAGSALKRREIAGEITLTKRDQSTDCQAGVNFINSASSTFLNTQDSLAAITAMAVGVAALPLDYAGAVDVSLTACANLQAAIVTFLNTVVASGNFYLDTVRAAPFAASLLQGSINQNIYTSQHIAEAIFALTKLATGTILKNSPNSCYNSDTAIKFLQVIEVILASLENSAVYSQAIGDSWSALLSSINTCQFNVRICGQSAFRFSSHLGYMNYQTGVQDVSLSRSFCDGNFTVEQWGNVSSDHSGCMKFTCRELSATGILPVGAIIHDPTLDPAGLNVNMSHRISRFTFTNSNATGANINITNAVINASVYMDADLVSAYGLENYNPLDTSKSKFVLVPAKLQFKDSNQFYSQASYNTSGISLSSDYSGNTAKLIADSIGTFAILIQRNVGQSVPIVSVPESTTSPISNTSKASVASNVGAIIGAVVGAAVAVFLVAGAVLAVRRRRRQRHTLQKVISTARSAAAIVEGAVVIQMAHEPVVVRTRDPALLPLYQLPPTYDEFMFAKEVGTQNNFGPLDEDGNAR